MCNIYCRFFLYASSCDQLSLHSEYHPGIFLLNNKIDMYENPEGPNLAVPYFFVAALLFDFRRFIIFLSVTIHHRNIKILATETYKFS